MLTLFRSTLAQSILKRLPEMIAKLSEQPFSIVGLSETDRRGWWRPRRSIAIRFRFASILGLLAKIPVGKGYVVATSWLGLDRRSLRGRQPADKRTQRC